MSETGTSTPGGFRERLRRLANLRLYDQNMVATLMGVDIERDERFMRIYDRCRPLTMSSIERMYALHHAVGYVAASRIAGDIVETGVWRGGSSMMAALTLLEHGSTDRQLWLYDTFEGMTEPTDLDLSYDGQSAKELWEKTPEWCAASLSDVQANMRATQYPFEQMRFIEGKVEDTIPAGGVPDSIALLRLDTDWYISNKHELNYLYPRLVTGGVLIIDDYGHWDGVRRSVDEYFAEHGITGLLNRIDYTGRMMIKP